MTAKRILLLSVLGFLLVGSTQPARSAWAQDAPGLLIPIGGGYSDVYAGFSAAAVANARNNAVKILVLPSAYSSNPLSITYGERQTNIRDAESRRYEIEEACKRAAPAGTVCTAIMVPVFVRADAENPANLALLTDDLAAVFILGGDQTIAMQTIVNTPVEKRLEELHNRGVIFAGTSAGGGMLSRSMLAGYSLNAASGNALDFGGVDVWNSPDRRGLSLGIQNAILDQHFYQRSRPGRLLNAICLPDVPHVGVGVDAYTGIISKDEVLQNVFGLYTVTVIDAETYHAAEGVRYAGTDNVLSIRNVLVNLLSPGDATYDLKTRRSSLAAPLPRVERMFDNLHLPAGAGPLVLAGNLESDLENNPILARFVELSGGTHAQLLVVASGYRSKSSAQTNIDNYSAALGKVTASINVDPNSITPITIPSDITGIVFIGRDQSKVNVAAVAPLKESWQAGIPVLADNAAAAVLGAFYSAHGPTPNDSEGAEMATQKSFIQERTTIQAGLGFLDLTIEPQLMEDNRWGRFYSLTYNHPDLVAFGLNDNTAIEITADGATVLGRNAVITLDLRAASLGLGTNNGFVIANGMMDVFAPGDQVAPVIADTSIIPDRQPTPMVTLPPTETPTPLPTEALPTAIWTAIPFATPEASPISHTNYSWMFIPAILLVVLVGLMLWLIKRKK